MPELHVGLLFRGFLRQERTCVVGIELGRRCPVTSLSGCVATSCFPLYCVSRLCLGASQIKVTCGSCRDPDAFSSTVGIS